MKYIISILALLLFISFIITKGINRHELVECEQLQLQSKSYPLFYSTSYQKEMCSQYNITLIK